MTIQPVRRRLDPQFENFEMSLKQLKNAVKKLDPFDDLDVLRALSSSARDCLEDMDAAISRIKY